MFKEVQNILEPIRQNEEDSGFVFANMLYCHIHEYFGFVLDHRRKDFQGIFWTTSYLSPFHRRILEKEKIPMTVVKKFLKGGIYIELSLPKYLTLSV